VRLKRSAVPQAQSGLPRPGAKNRCVCGGVGGAKNGASGVHVGTGRSAAVVFQFLVSSFFF